MRLTLLKIKAGMSPLPGGRSHSARKFPSKEARGVANFYTVCFTLPFTYLLIVLVSNATEFLVNLSGPSTTVHSSPPPSCDVIA